MRAALLLTVSLATSLVVAGQATGQPGKPQGVGTVSGSVAVTLKGKAKTTNDGVVVYLEGVPGTPPTPKDHAVIRQREKQFVPPPRSSALPLPARGPCLPG